MPYPDMLDELTEVVAEVIVDPCHKECESHATIYGSDKIARAVIDYLLAQDLTKLIDKIKSADLT